MYTNKEASSGYALNDPIEESHGNSKLSKIVPEADKEEEEDAHLPLSDRLLHNKWRVKLDAFKELNTIFLNDYSKFEQTGQKEDMQNFEHYGPLLQEMLKE